MLVRIWIALALLLPLAGVAAETPPRWTVRFDKWKFTERMIVASPNLTVTFIRNHAWNVSEIIYQGRNVGQASGATGTVVTWDGKPVGTGHGGEVVHELVLAVDGRPVMLIADGQDRYDRTAEYGGAKLRLDKRSTIGPFAYEASFDFPEHGDFYATEVRFTAREKITPERFVGYRYVFMQMMPGLFTQYATVTGDGSVRRGTVEPLPDPKRQKYVFEAESFRALVCYAPEWKTGIAHVYPRQYAGTNHLLNRGKKDIKFRAMLLADHYELGETAEFRMKVIPFAAEAGRWEIAGKTLALGK